MPGYDGIGPMGRGSGTGGGRGFCQPGTRTVSNNNSRPVYVTGRKDMSFGGGRRRVGVNTGNRQFDASCRMRSGQETEYLKNRAADIERELERIRERIREMEANTDK